MEKTFIACSLLLLVLFAGCKKEDTVLVTDCITEDVEGSGRGCGFAHLYHRFNDDETLSLDLNPNEFQPAEPCTTLQLDGNSAGVYLTLEIGRGDPDSVYFFHCNDAVPPNLTDPDIWTLQSASAVIFISHPERYMEKPVVSPNPFQVSALLTDMVFEDGTGEIREIPEFYFKEVTCGWLAG